MNETELLACLEKNYKIRKRRLTNAIRDGAERSARPLRTTGEACAICLLKEHGGGLLVYQLRDGQELLVGHKCADYIDYLVSHPDYARDY